MTGNPWEYLRRVMCNELDQQVHPAAPQRGLKGLLAPHPLVCFFLLAYDVAKDKGPAFSLGLLTVILTVIGYESRSPSPLRASFWWLGSTWP